MIKSRVLVGRSYLLCRREEHLACLLRCLTNDSLMRSENGMC